MGDPLSPEQFNFRHDTYQSGASYPTQRVRAYTSDGAFAGRLTWSPKQVEEVSVPEDFRRQGIATGMWNHAQQVASENARVPAPKHSKDRTDAGDAWARSVGGRVPRRSAWKEA